MESYDVVVIGAGNGGLTASVTLAQKGLQVLLLERHNVPGGCATSFCRGRFEFEVALHQLSGVGTAENPGPLRMLLDQLGVLKELELVEMKDLFHVIGPGGFRVALKPDREQVVAALKEKFSGQEEGIELFFDLSYQYAYQMLSAFYFKDPEPSREKFPVLYRYAYKPAIEVLDELFSDPHLKAVLSSYWGFLGLPPTRLSFAYLAMLFFVYIEYKPFHLKGGSQALSNALLDRFLTQGGTARFSCGAERIRLSNGNVAGVVTETGEEIAARYVVSNASPVTTYTGLLGPENAPESVLREMHGRSLSPSAFVLYIGCDCEPRELGITGSMNFLAAHTDISDKNLLDMQRLELGDQFLAVSCYDVADPDFSPRGTCQLNAVTLKYGEPWLRVPPGEYHQVKFRVAESMLVRLESAFPGLRGHIEEIEAATPLTHMRYQGHPNGAVYGFEQYTKDSMFFQPGRKSPIPGLAFASGWTGDCGFQPTLEAGAAAARTIIREIDGK
ncbi:MAG: NAD(P)/FAD-dependent oxidoreductase [Deltaproteobacteria bacterium]|nr:NAD(P)/FAD-dependent oxidoreductase [Deltaproteobacteria bacterium]